MFNLITFIAAAALLQVAPPEVETSTTAEPAVPTASAPEPLTEAVPAAAAPAGGKIIMFRPGSIMGAGIACPIRYKGQEIVELGRGKFAEWQVAPGRYILNNKTASVEVSVDPGETRYVRCMIKAGFLTGRADLQIVDEESFGDGGSRYSRKDVNVIPVAASITR